MANSTPPICTVCGDDEISLTNDKYYGWICDPCRNDLDRIDLETDWDDFEEKRRNRIQEANEY